MPDILHSLGIDEENFDWRDLAICQFMPTSLFYEDYESDAEIAKATDQACISCPVISECFFHAADSGEHGVWGGVYWNGSGKPDTNRNSHKTQAVWDTIRERVGN